MEFRDTLEQNLKYMDDGLLSLDVEFFPLIDCFRIIALFRGVSANVYMSNLIVPTSVAMHVLEDEELANLVYINRKALH